MTANTSVIKKIQEVIPSEQVHVNELMCLHTSFRIGGGADALVEVHNENELAAVLQLVKEYDAEHMVIGNGTNLLVSDDGYRGIMIKLAGDFDAIKVDPLDPTVVRAGGARLLSSFSAKLIEMGLAGFEFASGIPGSIGGAIYMNAGAYGGEMKDVVRSVKLMSPDGSEIVDRVNSEMNFGYRHSIVQEDGYIVLSVAFKFEKDDSAAITARVEELREKRNSKQPVEYPSAGSTFKRPVGGYAAALIDEAGLKGYKVGGAQVSEKHAGFVINNKGAKCEDVLALMKHVQEAVYEKSDIKLEPEVKLINCELK